MRIDDKLSRLMCAQSDEDEDVDLDLIGYRFYAGSPRRCSNERRHHRHPVQGKTNAE